MPGGFFTTEPPEKPLVSGEDPLTSWAVDGHLLAMFAHGLSLVHVHGKRVFMTLFLFIRG